MKKIILLSLLFVSIGTFAQNYYKNINPGGGAVLYELRLAENPIEVPVERQVKQMFYSDGLFIYTTDTNTPWLCKWTIIDTEGNKLASDMPPFWNSQAGLEPEFYHRRAISKDGSIIDPTYKVIVEPKKGLFAISPSFVDGIASICTEIRDKNDIQLGFKTEYMDIDGNVVYKHLSVSVDDPMLFPVRKLNDGRRAFLDVKQKKWGYLNEEGAIVIHPQYQEVHDFREGMAAVKTQEGMWGFIDPSGQMVIEPRFSIEPGDFYCGMAVVTRQNEQSTLLYKDGSVYGENFGRITPAIKDYCLAEQYRGGDLLLFNKEKGVIGKLPGYRYELYVETDYRVPFYQFYSAIYTYDMIPIWKISSARYLSDGWFWKNSNLNYAAVIFNVLGECKIVFPYKTNDSF